MSKLEYVPVALALGFLVFAALSSMPPYGYISCEYENSEDETESAGAVEALSDLDASDTVGYQATAARGQPNMHPTETTISASGNVTLIIEHERNLYIEHCDARQDAIHPAVYDATQSVEYLLTGELEP